MPVLSIIACRMFEDELAHVLSSDRELEQLIVVEGRDSFGLLRKLKSVNCLTRTAPLDRVPFLLGNRHSSGSGSGLMALAKPLLRLPFFGEIHGKMKLKAAHRVTVVVNPLRLGLHDDLELLKSEVYGKIREMAAFSDGILLFYCSCGKAFESLEEDFSGFECPLYCLKDGNGEVVADCISAALGGNAAYDETMYACRGTGALYFTPMWASSWKEMGEKRKKSRNFDDNYLKDPRYSRVVKLDTGLSYDPDFHKNIQDFARTFNMEIVEIKGSTELAEKSYMAARKGVIQHTIE
ncbi:MAG: DUF1638 domain-containing protein [Methanosarcina sp.]|uniref:DUF1638 domain-containing protein n=1 Tax=Methanosarcina sp. TaxID=2213 RepID=UPI002620FA9B|nr:DUF1638 domain-containing protein [Methanosarcina sp.]MDD3245743.1 DUF1638 domain-containing protein [Methanosarcina sp.]MDD4248714.1 DUF1638 domain-containing protein [Methanosarcina sp.]